MPATSEITSPPRRNYEVSDTYANGSLGAFTTIALLILFWGLCWLKGHVAFRQPQHINVVFHEVAGLNDNAGVFVDGVRVGFVDGIEWQGHRRVVVRTKITTHGITVPQGSKFSILANGVVGAKYVEIAMPATNSGVPIEKIAENAEVLGEDPVRPELAVNNLAIGLSKIDMDKLERNLEADRARLVRAADQLALLSTKAIPAIEHAVPLEKEVILLSKDARKVSSKLAKLMDNPQLTSDLKETLENARETMLNVHSVVRELRLTLNDKSVRTDIVGAISKLNTASEHMEKSVAMIQGVAGDKVLRDDIKRILQETRLTVNRVSEVLNDPTSDVQGMLKQTRAAVEHVDLAARQMNQILDKRNPLFHMLIGRPGRIKTEQKDKANKNKEVKKELKEELKEEQKEQKQQKQQKQQQKEEQKSIESGLK